MAVIVLGMHRSGTSALTRCVNLMGLPVGRDADLLPANEENPRGFWENRRLTQLNDDLLEALGGFWSAPPELPGAWWRDPRLADLRAEAQQLIADTELAGARWCWKDPRNCLTLPFWRPLLTARPLLLFVHRHPLEIWRSLEQRNGFTKRHALGLWSIYSAAALQQLQQAPAMVIAYRELLDDPRGVLGRTRAFLARHGIEGLREPAPGAVEEFLSRDLRHWSHTDAELLEDGAVTGAEQALWAALRALPAEPGVEQLRAAAASANQALQRGDARLTAYAAEAMALQHRLEAARGELDAVRRSYDERIETLETARTRADACRRKVADRVGAHLRAVRGQLGGGGLRSTESPPAGAPCDILIPVYDAYEHVGRCVESVLAHTDGRHPVFLLDDASPDPRIRPLLEALARRDPRVQLLAAEQNLGFVGNVNRGFHLSRNDVVILNSDTEVTPGWLERMQRCLGSAPEIGIVSPLSNNATLLSVPVMNESNQLPPDLRPADFAALVAHSSARLYPRLPTAVGFCMLISRPALDELDRFDPAFGRGYGEECDFSMRAWQAGIEVACCDDAYVHHYGEASFGDLGRLDARRQRSERLLELFWPDYLRAVYGYCHANPLREVQERIRTALGRRGGGASPHVLHVIHSFDTPGGTELHTRQMIDRLAGQFRSTVLAPGLQGGAWADMVADERAGHLRVVRLSRENVVSNEYFLHLPGDLEAVTVESNFARLLAGSDIDIVHFQHLGGWGTLNLPFIARALGKRVVLSVHDYFLLCPEYNLVDPEMRRCGKERASADDEGCFRCLGEKRMVRDESRQVQLHEYLAERQATMARILDEADAVVVPSRFVERQLARAFGEPVAEKIRIFPHGIQPLARSPRPPRRAVLRVGFLGNMTDRKGGRVILEAARLLRGQPVCFEVFGGVMPAFAQEAAALGLGLRGAYRGDELPQLLAGVDLVVIPSVWDETYCLTVSEAQAMGVPLVASAVGAIGERVEDGRTGWLVPPGDAGALARRLQALAADPRALEPVVELLQRLAQRTLEENAADYEALYHELLADRDDGAELVRALLGLEPRAALAPQPCTVGSRPPAALSSRSISSQVRQRTAKAAAG